MYNLEHSINIEVLLVINVGQYKYQVELMGLYGEFRQIYIFERIEV